MKRLLILFAFLSPFSNAELAPKQEVYFFKKMLCSGTQAAANPVDDYWANMGIKFIQFRSEKNEANGGGFAWSLGTGTCFEDSIKEVEKELQEYRGCGSSVWFSGLLKKKEVDGKTVVYHPDRDDLELEVLVDFADPHSGTRSQTLQGKFWYWSTKTASPEGGFDVICTAEFY